MDLRPVLPTVAAGDSVFLSGVVQLGGDTVAEPQFLVIIVDDNSGR